MEKRDAALVPWDASRFRAWVDEVYAGESLLVLANRHPLQCVETTGDGAPLGSSGELVTTLEPLIDNCRLVWVARGNTGAPVQGMFNRYDGPHVSPASPRVRLRHVSLTPQEEQGYYDGFCGEGLWPLCHRTSVRPTFRDDDFRMYSLANTRWVTTLCEEVVTHSPIVLVQDYHLALAPRMIRARLPLAAIATFWHIPFPTPRALSVCPWERELLEGLLGSSILGFQTREECQNFLDATICVLGAHVDPDTDIVSYDGCRTLVRAYPTSVECPNQGVLHLPPIAVSRNVVRRRYGLSPDARLIVAVDRLDFTKGLPEKFFALERLLIMRPEFRGNVVLLQVIEPGRASSPICRDYRTHVYQTADRINQRFATTSYEPIVLLDRHVNKSEMFELLRAGDVCYVGSLHDGMNLVSKEFVSARDDESGVLILSEFAGSAHELSDALSINPYASDDCARTLAEALTMPSEEQAIRMRSMRAIVQRSNAYQWVANVLTDAAAVRARFGHRFGFVGPTEAPVPTTAT